MMHSYLLLIVQYTQVECEAVLLLSVRERCIWDNYDMAVSLVFFSSFDSHAHSPKDLVAHYFEVYSFVRGALDVIENRGWPKM